MPRKSGKKTIQGKYTYFNFTCDDCDKPIFIRKSKWFRILDAGGIMHYCKKCELERYPNF